MKSICNIFNILIIATVFTCALAGQLTVNELYKTYYIKKLGVSPEPTVDHDENMYYQARFFIAKQNLLITINAYLDSKTNDINRRNLNENKTFYVESWPLTISRITVEFRQLINDKVSTETLALNGQNAENLDSYLHYVEIFSLKQLAPWAEKMPHSGDAVLAQLAIDGEDKVIEVIKYTDESLPAKAIIEKLLAMKNDAINCLKGEQVQK